MVLLTSVNVLGTRHLDNATEDLPCRRSGDASADVKVEIEALAHEYEQRYGVDMTILRPGLIYGPRDRHNVPQMIRALRRGKFAFIGSRDHVAPIVHVSDVVQAILSAGRTPSSQGRVYHITDGSRTTIGQFVDRLAELVGCPPPRKVLPYAVPLPGLFRLRVPRLRCGSIEAVRRSREPACVTSAPRAFSASTAHRKELGYVPHVPTGRIKTAVEWMKEHAHGQFPSPELSVKCCESASGRSCGSTGHSPTLPSRSPRLPRACRGTRRTALDTLLTRQFRVGPLPPRVPVRSVSRSDPPLCAPRASRFASRWATAP